MPVLITHPTGNVFFRAAAKGLLDAGKLQSVYTALAVFPSTIAYKLAGIKALSELKRRSMPAEFKNITHTSPWRECGRLLATRSGIKNLTRHETGMFSVDAVYTGLDKFVASRLKKEKENGLTVLYAYEDGAYRSFKKAKDIDISCLYDLPIGYWRTMHTMLTTEKELNPEWAITLGGFKDSQQKLNRKDEELRMADTTFVASSFTQQTLKDYPGNLQNVQLVPYGFPPATPKQYRQFSGRLKLLFVGGLSQRKGLSYLFKAVEALKDHVELTVVGDGDITACRPLRDALSRHSWIKTLPHNKVLELMRENDVLVFPSLFEGFGQVITEAMAQGTPVITTERTAGPDIITHEKNGWIIEAGSAEALQHCIEELLLKPELIPEAGTAAVEKASQRPWEVYGSELAAAID